MSKIKFKDIVKEAHAERASKINLRPEQLEDLYMEAHVRLAGQNAPKRRMWVKVLVPVTAIAASAACLVVLSYRHGANSAELTAQSEIARLQTELEKTKQIRTEFAQLVKRYGREKIARMAHSNIDYETAILIAEENYVQNIGNFRAELLAAVKREESAAGEKPYNNRSL